METKPRMKRAPVPHFLTLFPHSPRLFISSLSRGSRCRLGLDRHSCHSHFLHLSNLHSLGKSICPATLSLGTQSISFIAFERCPIQGLTLTSTGYLMEPTDEGGASKLSRATNSVRSLLSTLLPIPQALLQSWCVERCSQTRTHCLSWRIQDVRDQSRCYATDPGDPIVP